jgi:ribosomal protein S18 acetylase RimI-like enzyme
MAFEVRLASAEEVPAIGELLAEATAWLRSRGIEQWPERFPEDLLVASQTDDELYVVRHGGRLAGTVTLQWSDPMFWGERDDAGFIHRLVISRAHAGIGRQVVRWAEAEVVARNRQFLCLDTLESNRRLRRYYEDLGFSAVGEVAGPAGHPHTTAHGQWRAVLYEKAATG